MDFRTLAKRIILTLLALLILPYLLIPVYALPFIRPVSTLMLADLATFQGYDRRWVPLEDISPRLVQSVMMSEDGQFCFHGGVDWNQMQSVVTDALDGASTRGASTIPMQTAKNLFLWNGRSFLRKGLELPLAIAADFVWSKKRMMEIYLNVAEWGRAFMASRPQPSTISKCRPQNSVPGRQHCSRSRCPIRSIVLQASPGADCKGSPVLLNVVPAPPAAMSAACWIKSLAPRQPFLKI